MWIYVRLTLVPVSTSSVVGEKVVKLGVALSEVEDGSQRVVLYYTGFRTATMEAASFKLGELTGRWAKFTLTVQGPEVGVLQHTLHSGAPQFAATSLCFLSALRCACTWTVRNTTAWPSTGTRSP